MISGRCPHPPATPKTDGIVGGIQAWCSNCGSAKINGQWHHPQMGKSGKKCHPTRGDYLLPTREQYVAAGYDAGGYDRFIQTLVSPLSECGF
jgi:hypothetical protein